MEPTNDSRDNNNKNRRSIDYVRYVAWVILLVFFLILIFIIYQLAQPYDYNFKTISLEEVRGQFKTGDLLGISYVTIHGKLVKIFTGSMWTHLGMVVINNNKKYVIEIARYNSVIHGVIIKPLDDWLDWNEGRTMAWRPYN